MQIADEFDIVTDSTKENRKGFLGHARKLARAKSNQEEQRVNAQAKTYKRRTMCKKAHTHSENANFACIQTTVFSYLFRLNDH